MKQVKISARDEKIQFGDDVMSFDQVVKFSNGRLESITGTKININNNIVGTLSKIKEVNDELYFNDGPIFKLPEHLDKIKYKNGDIFYNNTLLNKDFNGIKINNGIYQEIEQKLLKNFIISGDKLIKIIKEEIYKYNVTFDEILDEDISRLLTNDDVKSGLSVDFIQNNIENISKVEISAVDVGPDCEILINSTPLIVKNTETVQIEKTIHHAEENPYDYTTDMKVDLNTNDTIMVVVNEDDKDVEKVYKYLGDKLTDKDLSEFTQDDFNNENLFTYIGEHVDAYDETGIVDVIKRYYNSVIFDGSNSVHDFKLKVTNPGNIENVVHSIDVKVYYKKPIKTKNVIEPEIVEFQEIIFSKLMNENTSINDLLTKVKDGDIIKIEFNGLVNGAKGFYSINDGYKEISENIISIQKTSDFDIQDIKIKTNGYVDNIKVSLETYNENKPDNDDLIHILYKIIKGETLDDDVCNNLVDFYEKYQIN